MVPEVFMAPTSVFVSYGNDTKPLADELIRALRKEGIEVWTDVKVHPGEPWQLSFERVADRADSFLILVGPENRGTPHQEAEWRTVLAKVWGDTEKKLIPVIVGSSEPPAFLRSWNSVHVNPESEPKTWTHHVIDALESGPSPSIQSLTRKSRRERNERFVELTKAVESLERSPYEIGGKGVI
jgi:TIR domain-containing protein